MSLLCTYMSGRATELPVTIAGVFHSLSIAGRILGRINMNRLSSHVFGHNIIPESQRVFRRVRGTADACPGGSVATVPAGLTGCRLLPTWVQSQVWKGFFNFQLD